MKEKIGRKLVDYILLNAYSVRSAGFYNGKAGLSLCLFEVSKCLNDEIIEEHAFELLQESIVLINKEDEISFENGLAGSGFVLHYLIENRIINANFDELFGEQTEKILDFLKKIEHYSEDYLLLLYFFESISYLEKYSLAKIFADKIIYNVEKSLERRFSDFGSLDSNEIKARTLATFEKYLKVIVFSTNYSVSISLLRQYIELFQRGLIASSFSIGYYLEKIELTFPDEKLAIIAKLNKDIAVRNIIPSSLFLPQRIDYLYLLHQNEELYEKQISVLERGIISNSISEIEKMTYNIQSGSFIAGYQSGIARLVLYWIYKNNKFNNRDYSRFEYIFR
jgi:hypothetical protein